MLPPSVFLNQWITSKSPARVKKLSGSEANQTRDDQDVGIWRKFLWDNEVQERSQNEASDQGKDAAHHVDLVIKAQFIEPLLEFVSHVFHHPPIRLSITGLAADNRPPAAEVLCRVTRGVCSNRTCFLCKMAGRASGSDCKRSLTTPHCSPSPAGRFTSAHRCGHQIPNGNFLRTYASDARCVRVDRAASQLAACRSEWLGVLTPFVWRT